MEVTESIPNYWLLVIWMALFFIYLYWMRRTMLGILDKFANGKYNDKLWTFFVRLLMKDDGKGNYEFNDRGTFLFNVFWHHVQKYFKQASSGKKGSIISNGGLAALAGDTNPLDLLAGKKNAGLLGTIMEYAPLLEKLGFIK